MFKGTESDGDLRELVADGSGHVSNTDRY